MWLKQRGQLFLFDIWNKILNRMTWQKVSGVFLSGLMYMLDQWLWNGIRVIRSVQSYVRSKNEMVTSLTQQTRGMCLVTFNATVSVNLNSRKWPHVQVPFWKCFGVIESFAELQVRPPHWPNWILFPWNISQRKPKQENNLHFKQPITWIYRARIKQDFVSCFLTTCLLKSITRVTLCPFILYRISQGSPPSDGGIALCPRFLLPFLDWSNPM